MTPTASTPATGTPVRRDPGGPPVTTRLAVSGGIGVLAAVVTAVLAPAWAIPLGAWGLAALVFVVWLWCSIWPLSPAQTAERSCSQDPGRASTDVILLSASVISLLAVGLVLIQANKSSGFQKGILVSLSVGSIILAWVVVHTVFSLRYAAMYYDGRPGGVDFNEDDPPDFADFAYFALTIGMTYQVSDTDIKTKAIRRTAVRHALLSFAFGTLIIATTINLVAGLGK
ncbi:MAG: hypothetical protein QOH12_1085 [Solirubrobacteraceae bacterium]|jgi:uncharacterized membrane protein|nr:hypothetical protein [Solirubrobacteraceae bacterium]